MIGGNDARIGTTITKYKPSRVLNILVSKDGANFQIHLSDFKCALAYYGPLPTVAWARRSQTDPLIR